MLTDIYAYKKHVTVLALLLYIKGHHVVTQTIRAYKEFGNLLITLMRGLEEFIVDLQFEIENLFGYVVKSGSNIYRAIRNKER